MTCPTCAGPVPRKEDLPMVQGRRQWKYCSPECQQGRTRRWYKRQKGDTTCVGCGSPVETEVKPGPLRKFCSLACKNRVENPKKRLARMGITPTRYDAMLAAQGGRCAICLTAFAETPCIDHDRSCCPGQGSCGKCVRGLLCHPCNTALGFFADDAVVMDRAIDYLAARAVL